MLQAGISRARFYTSKGNHGELLLRSGASIRSKAGAGKPTFGDILLPPLSAPRVPSRCSRHRRIARDLGITAC